MQRGIHCQEPEGSRVSLLGDAALAVWGPCSHHLERDVSRSFEGLCGSAAAFRDLGVEGFAQPPTPHPSSQPGTSLFWLHLPPAVGEGALSQDH